jgi:mannose-1-phosphate guanylyltransferase
MEINNASSGHVSTTSSAIINTSSANFGFIPKKKSRDEVADVSMQIRNLIVDPEQATPVQYIVLFNYNYNSNIHIYI